MPHSRVHALSSDHLGRVLVGDGAFLRWLELGTNGTGLAMRHSASLQICTLICSFHCHHLTSSFDNKCLTHVLSQLCHLPPIILYAPELLANYIIRGQTPLVLLDFRSTTQIGVNHSTQITSRRVFPSLCLVISNSSSIYFFMGLKRLLTPGS
ncbi:unnamed protein product [Protopolystoma xenopodis]|uniref:Uncharacterized protein n=1 Tax=Protopolystoma xenopodis TaxID=117903 RepID=A0A448XGY0_9PLAT|nr:unnamed protein product [Protopolystoma xenopodis]